MAPLSLYMEGGMMPLKDYLSALDMSALPDTFIDDILAEAAGDSAPNLAEIERLNSALADSDGRANTTAAELEDLKARYNAVAAHNYELVMNGGKVEDANAVTIESDDDNVLIEDDPVLDKFFTDVDN